LNLELPDLRLEVPTCNLNFEPATSTSNLIFDLKLKPEPAPGLATSKHDMEVS
jgi:hypothetical protein